MQQLRNALSAHQTILFLALASGLLLGGPAQAKVDAEQAAKLGKTLTPVGAEKAGDGDRIPAWDGGLPQKDVGRGYQPFEDDEPLFTITAKNASEYADVLTPTHKALFKQYPDTYSMPVYATRRSASLPQRIYDQTKANATSVELTNEGNGFCCTAGGFPFPIPGNGQEVLWNHIMRFRTSGVRGHFNHARTAKGGDYVVQRNYFEAVNLYGREGMTVEELDNQFLYVMTKITAPPSLAGDAYLLHVPIDRVKETTGVWLFNLGQGRVRRVSDIGYDNPAFDGLMTHDQFDMFNGPSDRYNLKLIGKKPMLVPYNSYALYDDDLEYDDIIQEGHINQELTRYELHRVWIVEATVREGMAHIYHKRVFYIDEDSWIILVQDIYDERGDFWRGAEAHMTTFATVPIPQAGVQTHYDLQGRRYVALNLTNEEDDFFDYEWDQPVKKFNPSGLKRFASKRQ